MVEVLGMEVLDALQNEPVLRGLFTDAHEVLQMPHTVARTERHPGDHRLAAELPRQREVAIRPLFGVKTQSEFHGVLPVL